MNEKEFVEINSCIKAEMIITKRQNSLVLKVKK